MPVTIIASYDKWLEFEEIYLEKWAISFIHIKDFINCRGEEKLNKQIALIETYAIEYPERFLHEFYHEFIWNANIENSRNELC